MDKPFVDHRDSFSQDRILIAKMCARYVYLADVAPDPTLLILHIYPLNSP